MDETLIPSEKSPDELSQEEKAELENIKKQLDAFDSNAVIQYGTGIQNKISDFADKILSEVRSRDTGYVGKVLTDLMNKLKDIHIDNLSGKSNGFFSKIPIIGSLLSSTKSFLNRYQSVSVQIVQIVEELDKAKMQLLQDVDMLNHFYDNNVEYFYGISMYIQAGETKLKELKETLLPKMKAESENTDNALEIQQYRDMVQLAGRLEKKIHDLKLSKTVALQTAPQIRLIQNNNQALAEKIQSSILNTIPLWKHQMVIAITIMRQSQLSGLQKEISETTNEILKKNAEMLKVSSIEIAKEAEKGIVDIETLKKVNSDLISTIEETLSIQQEGRIRRDEAAKEIEKIEKELKDKLLEIKNDAKKVAGSA